MSLIRCSECGKNISEYAESCPNCGCPMDIIKKKLEERKEVLNRFEEEQNKKTKNFNERKEELLKAKQELIKNEMNENNTKNLFLSNQYVFEYVDENDFRRKERRLRKYNMFAYKELTFKYYPKIRSGNFLGKEVGKGKHGNIMYELELPTEEEFSKKYGPLILQYEAFSEEKIILLVDIISIDKLDEKCDPRSNDDKRKDMFKVNLLNMMNKG